MHSPTFICIYLYLYAFTYIHLHLYLHTFDYKIVQFLNVFGCWSYADWRYVRLSGAQDTCLHCCPTSKFNCCLCMVKVLVAGFSFATWLTGGNFLRSSCPHGEHIPGTKIILAIQTTAVIATGYPLRKARAFCFSLSYFAVTGSKCRFFTFSLSTSARTVINCSVISTTNAIAFITTLAFSSNTRALSCFLVQGWDFWTGPYSRFSISPTIAKHLFFSSRVTCCWHFFWVCCVENTFISFNSEGNHQKLGRVYEILQEIR